MYFITASIYSDESEDDEIVIGLFSTPEKAITAARAWVKEEREEAYSEEDILLNGWNCTPDSSKIERLDLSHDKEDIKIITAFRKIEKDFPAKIKDEDEDE